MPLKKEQPIQSTPVQNATSNWVHSTSYTSVWNVANFATVALATSTGVVCIQSPIKTMLLSLSQNNVLLPSYRGGFLGCVRALYAGTQTSLGSSSIRTAYAAGTKSNKANEPIKEEFIKEERHSDSNYKVGYVMAAAFGDVVVGQIPSSLADYKKAHIIPSNFKWLTAHNVRQLVQGNFGVKYCNSFVSFYSMCVIEQKYSEYLTVIPPSIARFVSGALSGVTSAILNYPLSAFIDYTQVRTQLKEGKLVNKSAFSSIVDLNKAFRADPQLALNIFFYNAVKQIPLRMLSSGAAFSIVAGVGNLLGAEPLQACVPAQYVPANNRSNVTFFSKSKNISPSQHKLDEQVSQSQQGISK